MAGSGRKRHRREAGRALAEPLSVNADGVMKELVRIGDDEVIVHYDDIPPGDITVIDGIPCTTALRTVIDLAPEIGADELGQMFEELLARGLFTLDDAHARLAAPDMASRSGATILRRYLSERR